MNSGVIDAILLDMILLFCPQEMNSQYVFP